MTGPLGRTLLFALLPVAAFAQTLAKPVFEVASMASGLVLARAPPDWTAP